MSAYCATFRRVLLAAYGEDTPVGAIIWSDTGIHTLPLRMVSFYLNAVDLDQVRVEPLQSERLHKKLQQLYARRDSAYAPALTYGRCIRSYESTQENGRSVLMVHCIKPDQRRYWTRSGALRDADSVAADIQMWASVPRSLDSYERMAVDG